MTLLGRETEVAPLGVALTGHRLAQDALCRLARDADALGYAVVLVDGDVSLLPRRPESPLYDSTALLAAALAATERAYVSSMRIPVYWNPVLLARSYATLQEQSGGRVFGLIAAGHGRHERQFGLPDLSAGQRVDLLDETLHALRALLDGEEVTRAGDHVRIDAVQVRAARPRVPMVVPAARPRALRVVERHADVWDANIPPLREHFDPLRQLLGRRIETWNWVFARPGAEFSDANRDYRRNAPWFRGLSEADVERAILFGDPSRCRDRIASLREELEIDLPILDLAGLDETGSRAALEALAPAKAPGIS